MPVPTEAEWGDKPLTTKGEWTPMAASATVYRLLNFEQFQQHVDYTATRRRGQSPEQSAPRTKLSAQECHRIVILFVGLYRKEVLRYRQQRRRNPRKDLPFFRRDYASRRWRKHNPIKASKPVPSKSIEEDSGAATKVEP